MKRKIQGANLNPLLMGIGFNIHSKNGTSDKELWLRGIRNIKVIYEIVSQFPNSNGKLTAKCSVLLGRYTSNEAAEEAIQGARDVATAAESLATFYSSEFPEADSSGCSGCFDPDS